MSGLNKRIVPRPSEPLDNDNKSSIIVDPTIELTQPGGPYPVGYALITDGMGGYTIDSTLKPYFVGFTLVSSVPPNSSVYCLHHGISSGEVGVVTTVPATIVGISISLNVAVDKNECYVVELIDDPIDKNEVIAKFDLTYGKRKHFRRDLSIRIDAGTEMSVIVRNTSDAESPFNTGLINIELES